MHQSGCFHASAYPKLAENVGDVDARGLRADEQRFADLGVGQSVGHHEQHVHFPSREPVLRQAVLARVGLRRFFGLIRVEAQPRLTGELLRVPDQRRGTDSRREGQRLGDGAFACRLLSGQDFGLPEPQQAVGQFVRAVDASPDVGCCRPQERVVNGGVSGALATRTSPGSPLPLDC